MNYIKSDNNDEIQVISQIPIDNPTCIINILPDDFYKYIGNSKYLANSEGLYIRENWFEYNFIVIFSIKLQAESLKSYALGTGDKYDYLGQLINSLIMNLIEKVKTDDTNIYVYLEQILPEHLIILQMFEEIKILEL